MNRLASIAMSLAFLLVSSSALGQTLTLNTGFNNQLTAQVAYPTVSVNPSPAGNRDNYWINIASFPLTGAPVGPSWVLTTLGTPWTAAMPASNWISGRNTYLSASGASESNPSYIIFQKCFCLLKGFNNAQVSFKVRADDTIQIWLNSQVNPLLVASWGNWNGLALTGGTTNQAYFLVGKNCARVLVEDFHGHMGFDLTGTVSANGLLPIAAAGTDGSFEPCACSSGHAGEAASARGAMQSDDEAIKELVQLAEARRTGKQRIEYRGKKPIEK